MSLGQVDWKEWSLLHRRLEPEQIESVRDGASFLGVGITGGRNTEDRVLYLDNLAVFTEVFKPLTFEPRPKRRNDPAPRLHHRHEHGPGSAPFPHARADHPARQPDARLPDVGAIRRRCLRLHLRRERRHARLSPGAEVGNLERHHGPMVRSPRLVDGPGSRRRDSPVRRRRRAAGDEPGPAPSQQGGTSRQPDPGRDGRVTVAADREPDGRRGHLHVQALEQVAGDRHALIAAARWPRCSSAAPRDCRRPGWSRIRSIPPRGAGRPWLSRERPTRLCS